MSLLMTVDWGSQFHVGLQQLVVILNIVDISPVHCLSTIDAERTPSPSHLTSRSQRRRRSVTTTSSCGVTCKSCNNNNNNNNNDVVVVSNSWSLDMCVYVDTTAAGVDWPLRPLNRTTTTTTTTTCQTTINYHENNCLAPRRRHRKVPWQLSPLRRPTTTTVTNQYYSLDLVSFTL